MVTDRDEISFEVRCVLVCLWFVWCLFRLIAYLASRFVY